MPEKRLEPFTLRQEKIAGFVIKPLWPKLVAMYRDFDDTQARTDRNIPVVVLSPS